MKGQISFLLKILYGIYRAVTRKTRMITEIEILRLSLVSASNSINIACELLKMNYDNPEKLSSKTGIIDSWEAAWHTLKTVKYAASNCCQQFNEKDKTLASFFKDAKKLIQQAIDEVSMVITLTRSRSHYSETLERMGNVKVLSEKIDKYFEEIFIGIA